MEVRIDDIMVKEYQDGSIDIMVAGNIIRFSEQGKEHLKNIFDILDNKLLKNTWHI